MSQSTTVTRSQKREQFAHHSAGRDKRTVVLFAILFITAAGLGYLMFGRNQSTTAALYSGGDVHIPLTEVVGEAKFMEYKTAGDKVIKFFVMRSSDGVYRAAADACEVCYQSRQGYHQQGDDMVCRKCGRHFPSKDVNVVTGGCNPSGIPLTVQGDQLVIAAADLDVHAVLF
jgi:uncharacterized membrane protein